jgi:hypothetical protein
MEVEEQTLDLAPAYLGGLLDAVGRVRFNINRMPEDTYTVRPELRFRPHQAHFRMAVIGEFLEERGYRYDFIDRDSGEQFFQLQHREDIRDLRSFLEGESAHISRELEFLEEAFANKFEYKILDPEEIYSA